MSKQRLFLLFLFFTIFFFVYRMYLYKDNYAKPFDAKYWQYRYDHSQWIAPSDCKNIDPHINPKTCAWDDAWYAAHKNDPFVKHEVISMGDDGLYSHVGWQLLTGKDPSLLNAEIPPFGKYLIGLTIFVFKNQNVYAVIMGVGVLIAMYFFNMTIFKDRLLAIIPVLFFSMEPLFYQQLAAPFLDLQMVFFLLLTFLFFLRKKYIISAVMLGLFTATKAPFLAAFVVLSCAVYLLVTKQKKELKKYAFSLPVSMLVYLFCYMMYFVHGHTLQEFISLQKWIVSFYSSGTKPPFYGMIFPMILGGTWHTWWGTVEQIKEWWIGWPVLFFSLVFSLFLYMQNFTRRFHFSSRFLFKKSITGIPADSKTILVGIWAVFYLAFLIITPVWPRYLLLLLPFLYNLTVWGIAQNIFRNHQRQ